jgi:glycosyltransferase involved in cell wall biosynthesis
LKADVVLSFINTSNVLTILAAKGLDIRVVVSERVQPDADPTLSLGRRALRRIFYAWSDEIVAQSRDAAKWIERNCRKSAIVIPNPLRALPRLTFERQPLIIAVGRLTDQKGFDLLIRAFAQIASEFEEWTIAIIGHGDALETLVKLRDELRLAQKVQFVGQIRDVETWMARAGLVVQPSRFEGFPNVILEAMGMGATVISSDCPSGPSDMIEDGINGRLVPVGDIAALANAMAELMSQRKVRESLGREAFETAQRYRQHLVMRQWESCLRGNS